MPCRLCFMCPASPTDMHGKVMVNQFMKFKFLQIDKIRDGRYLKNYELKYLNKEGKEKVYEIVSHHNIESVNDIGKNPSGVSIVAIKDDRLLLLKELRLGVNKEIYNLCAGMIEKGESIEECVRRELYEEAGLNLKKIRTILPPSFAAVSISDITVQLAIVDVDGEIDDHTSANEQIISNFYTRDEVKELLKTESFSTRAQFAAYIFAYNTTI